SHGVPPSEAVVVPAFQRFLESEAELQVPPPPLAPADSELRRRTNSTSGPVSGIYKRPAGMTIGGIGAAAAAPPPTAPQTAPSPQLKPPSIPSSPGLGNSRPGSAAEIDVELVTIPLAPRGPEDFEPLTPRVVASPPPRPVYDLDRRDFMMLGIGAGGVIAAIGTGFIVALYMKGKVQRDPNEESGPNQP
ncbi:MAG: hypothetical protein ACRCZF_14005, partial [Gemmataceae bacterium]